MSPGGKEIKLRQKLLLLQESQWNIFFLIKIFQKEKLVWNAYLMFPFWASFNTVVNIGLFQKKLKVGNIFLNQPDTAFDG